MLRVPDFYNEFRCLAGACPHTCCAAWDVVLDEETAERYRHVPGELGQRLRSAMVTEEGETAFLLHGGRCPFLNKENLCEIHCALGEAATSETCRSHPRFTEEYEGLREVTLSASCPAAKELLFGSDAPLTFADIDDGETPLDDPLFALRGELFGVLQNRERPLKERFAHLLALGWAAQTLMDEGEDDALYDLTAETVELPETEGEGLFPGGVEFLGELEVLEEDWRELLSSAKDTADLEADAAALERLCAYFLFRWLCKAMGDGDVLSKVELAVFAPLLCARLKCGIPEGARCFSREVEHCEENLTALQEGFCFDPRLGLERFFNSLK